VHERNIQSSNLDNFHGWTVIKSTFIQWLNSVKLSKEEETININQKTSIVEEEFESKITVARAKYELKISTINDNKSNDSIIKENCLMMK
jgi:hypothetical protein